MRDGLVAVGQTLPALEVEVGVGVARTGPELALGELEELQTGLWDPSVASGYIKLEYLNREAHGKFFQLFYFENFPPCILAAVWRRGC